MPVGHLTPLMRTFIDLLNDTLTDYTWPFKMPDRLEAAFLHMILKFLIPALNATTPELN